MPVRQEASAKPLYSDLHDNILVHAYVTLIKTTYLLYSDQMSKRSQVSRIAHLRCSPNVFVFVFVFVFVIVFFLVRSCLLITLIKCLKGHKSLGLLIEGVL